MNSSHTKYGIGALTNRLGLSGSSLLTIAVVCTVILGTVSIPVAGDQTGEVDESEMAYVDEDSGMVHIVDANGNTRNMGVEAEIVGPPADIDGDDAVEVPFVNSTGTLWLVEPDGNKEKLANGAAYEETAIALGDFDDDGTAAVIYENASDSNSIYYVEPGEDPQRFTDTDASSGMMGVVSYDNFDDDDAKEVVYVGGSGRIWHVDKNSDPEDTGSPQVGANSDAGLGAGPLGAFSAS